MKKFLGYVLLAIVVFGLGFYAWQKNESNNTTTSHINTLRWKTYTNPQAGFSFKYPSDWYVFPNNAIEEKMCQAEFNFESSGANRYTASNPCINSDFVVEVQNINGFCTKGGCVDTSLKRIQNTPLGKYFSVVKISESDKSKLIANYINLPNARISNVGKSEVYYFPQTSGNYPVIIAFFKAGGIYYKMTTAVETGTEIEEVSVMQDVLTTLKVTK